MFEWSCCVSLVVIFLLFFCSLFFEFLRWIFLLSCLAFFQAYHLWSVSFLQVAALILENTFTSILDMAGVLLPFLKWFIGGSGSKGPRILNCLVRSPWSTIDIIGEVRLHVCSPIQDCMPLLDSGTGSANKIQFSDVLGTMSWCSALLVLFLS